MNHLILARRWIVLNHTVVRMQKPRQIAADILCERAEGADFVESITERLLAHSQIAGADRGFVVEIVYGVVRWQATLDELILMRTEGRTQKETLRILLRMGLYQILWLDRVPDHAAVHETVELAKQLGFGPQSGFINAILRHYTREKGATHALLERWKVEKPAVGHSHPLWLVERWQKRWGVDLCGRLLEDNNDPSKVFARRNSLAVSADDLEKAWAEAGVKAVSRSFDWVGDRIVYEFESAPAVASLPGFAEGWFYVQDPSTLLAASQMEVRPGMTVLDLCAAPGGKATMLAQLMGDEGLVVAEDSDPMRLRWVEENSLRLRLKSIRVGPGEPGVLYDAVLVDAPCSNTGVMRRRVDLRWRIQEPEILRLALEQADILHTASLRVKPGGTLVYSTCSIEVEENQLVAKAFVRSHPEYVMDSERELVPFSGNCDGAYVATLKRRAVM